MSQTLANFADNEQVIVNQCKVERMELEERVSVYGGGDKSMTIQICCPRHRWRALNTH